MKIRVIDDDAPLQRLLRHFLELEGYEVTEPGEGWAGLRKAQTLLREPILCDFEMED